MNTMEFDELQKIWDVQSNAPLYAINENALHNRILSKKKKTRRITNVSELLLIIVNLCAGSFVLGINLLKRPGNIFMYVMAGWMFVTAFYVLAGRLRRIKGDRRFDRSMHGDLSHALSVATYQVRLSGLMRWNILPIGALSILGVWEGGKLFWIIGFIAIFFLLTWYASNWEHRIYVNKKRELETLQKKLEDLNA
jgi:hypothetical protein